MINRSYNMGVFLRQPDRTVISIRKKNQLVTSLVQNILQIRITVQIPQKHGNRQ